MKTNANSNTIPKKSDKTLAGAKSWCSDSALLLNLRIFLLQVPNMGL